MPDTMLKMLKADDGSARVGGYLVVFGSPQQRDLQGEFFTPDTEFHLDWYSKRPMLYHHGLDGKMKSSMIGVIDSIRADDVGLWAEAQLDMRDAYVDEVRKLIERGVLGWSSGSVPHLVKIADNGHIQAWPIIEGSSTPTPAEPRRTEISVLKAIKGVTELIDLEGLQAKAGEEGQTNASDTLTTVTPLPQVEHTTATKADLAATHPTLSNETPEPKRSIKMEIQGIIEAVIAALGVTLSPEETQQLVDAVTQKLSETAPEDATMSAPEGGPPAFAPAFLRSAFAEGSEIMRFAVEQALQIKAAKEFTTSLAASVKNTQTSIVGQGGVRQAQGVQDASKKPVKNDITLKTKFEQAGFTPEDYSYYAMLQKGRKSWSQVPEQFLRELSDHAYKAWNTGAIKLDKPMVEGLKAMKANELNHSTQSGYGDEWVPDMWASTLWERSRLDNVAQGLITNIEMPSDPFNIPIEGADPTVYHVAETTAENTLALDITTSPIPDSKVATGKVQLAAEKLGLRVPLSAEVNEDSIIPFIAQMRRQAERAMQDAIDNVIINGDTVLTANTNLNLIDGTPTTQAYTAQDGFLKLPIITTTANAVDMGGAAPTLVQLRNVRSKLPVYYRFKLADLAWIVDGETYVKLLNIDEFLTVDKLGALATNLTGEVGRIDNIPVYVSEQIALANTAGKVPNGGGTLGRALLVYRPGWYFGFRRRVSTDVSFIPWADAHQLTMTARIALINRDAEVAAALYNIAV